MRIALVTPAYPPLPGGGERYVAALANSLAQRGYPITVLTSGATAETQLWSGTAQDRPAETVENSVRVIRCPIRPFPGGRRGLMLWRKAMVVLSSLPGDQTPVLSRMAAQVPPILGMGEALAALNEVNLVHAFNLSWEGGLVAADEFCRRRGLPLVVTPFAHLGTGKGDRVARNSTMDHQLAIMRRSARVLVLTSVEREDLIEYGLPVERIDVIGGGVDPLPESGLGREPASVALYDLPPVYGIFIGRLSFDKGAIHAAEAVRLLRLSGEEVALLLVGATTPEFDRYYNRLSAADRRAIRSLGLIGETEKQHLLAGARFLMLPSRSDSFGIVILEAWANGVPVIAARAGGIPGVVDDGENGLLVPFGDVPELAAAAGRTLADPAWARGLGENGRRKVAAQYNWESVTARVLSHYEAISAGY